MKGPQNSHAEAVLLEARQLGRVDLPSQATLLAPTDFCLRAGERIALIGASGSGKSVLLRTLALLDAPSSGEVLWLGEPLTPPLIPNFRAHACYLTQRAALVDGSVMDNLRLPFTLKHNRHRRFDTAQAVRLLELAGKPTGFADKATFDLSGGEAQLVALIRALLLAPQVLLLDEPTSALDPQSVAAAEALVTNWLEEAPDSRAFLWITHDHAQAQRISTRTLTMHQGTLLK